MTKKIKSFIWHSLLGISLFLNGCQSDRQALNKEPSPPTFKSPKTVSVQQFLAQPIDWTFIKKNLKVYATALKTTQTYVQADTYFTLKNDSLQDATIIDSGQFLNHDIYIGMPQAAFEALFSDLKSQPEYPYILKLNEDIAIGCCTSKEPHWTFEFEDGVLMQINFNM